ncbi:S1C family serine protease [Chloroflexota bacterium]
MSKVRLIIVFTSAVGIVAVMLGSFLFSIDTKNGALPELSATGKTYAGLGITYLPITRGLPEYYELGGESGALITEVIPGSPTDRAGLRAGDVILSFNGARPEEQAPLLGMMMACSAGDTVTLEVWRVNKTVVVEFLHTDR